MRNHINANTNHIQIVVWVEIHIPPTTQDKAVQYTELITTFMPFYTVSVLVKSKLEVQHTPVCQRISQQRRR